MITLLKVVQLLAMLELDYNTVTKRPHVTGDLMGNNVKMMLKLQYMGKTVKSPHTFLNILFH